MEWNSKFNEPNESLGFLLWRVTQTWQRMITKELNKISLTHAQFVLLAASDFLNSCGEKVTQKKLSEFTHSNCMMVSDVVRTLETKGLIIRTKNPSDKREIILSPTEEGLNRVKIALPIVEAVDVGFFGNIMEKEARLNQILIRLLSLNTFDEK
ncbi:winged helix-turn-helix transcriptional regulator [Bacillus sp. RG28]|uniref:Winged helix-turn-helix transcriptional regulator n=1 Tax=Gottfriedia endophytica TaxID=2820819 RepID=A0A940NMZ4_9BACI|nr:MarR family winged helix-turn-helix transcriptional regulator [Gottfriedia endophytica]MBP0723772.1 winged helix-turn-helix transcriptional regulator [Gottfriedia endophytica]